MVDPLSDRSEALGLILSIEKEGKGKKETRTIWSADKPLLNRLMALHLAFSAVGLQERLVNALQE